ncbi:MAG TPA: hypothetical protein VGS97_08755 [Actinocrinis sp.]|nr:hypothetical protein [Actinocrinis sp.]
MRVPDRSAKRSERSILAALAAWVLLAVLVLGVPLGLAYLIGWPLSGVHVPLGLPHRPWTAHTLFRVAMFVIWLLWAQFAASVIVEFRSALTGIEIPTRIPGAALSRTAARAIVAVALTASVAGATVTAASARPVAAVSIDVGGVRAHLPQQASGPLARTPQPVAQAQTRQPAVLTDLAGPHVASNTVATNTVATNTEAAAMATLKYYVVEPPGGRRHDSLWDIAQRYLGDGRRYREIFALNVGRLQPDGTQLQHASLIRPGWVLVLPSDAQGPGLSVQLPASASASTPSPQLPQTSLPPIQSTPVHDPTTSATQTNGDGEAPKTYAMPGSQNGTNPATVTPGSGAIPHPVASRPALPHEQPAGPHSSDGSVLHSISDVLPYVGLIGSPVLAAALLAGLTAAARRRRRDHPAATIAAPPDPAIAEVERTIRAAASCDTIDLVERAMRALRGGCEVEGRVPPDLRYVRTDPDGLYLVLGRPDTRAPAPWSVLAGDQQWRFDSEAPLPDEPTRHAVPYPLLLAVGSLGEEQILVNLEASAGRCTAVTGPSRQRRAVLAAAAATLAAAPWADQIRIEAVGLPAELALLAPERLRVHPDLPAALGALEEQAAATSPHLVRLLIAESVAPEDADRLRVLTAGADGSTAALVGTEQPWPDFTVLTVDPVGRLRVPGVPGDLTAARLPDALAAALGALFRVAAAPRYAPAFRPADAEAFGGADLADQPVGVRARILGPVELTGVGPADAARGPLFTEALVLLLFHRAGLPAPVFARALWPRGITPAARDRMLRDMRDWLGEGVDGPRLTVAQDGLVRLTDDVRADWEEFQAAYRDAGRLADGAAHWDAAEAALVRALHLVRGELLADRPAGRYSWLGFGTQETEVPAVIADAAYRLAAQRLARGDAAGAQWAAEKGLLGAPDDERLVQIKIRGIAAQGDRERLHDVIADLKVRAWYRHGETDLHPSTSAVVTELFEGLQGLRA